jgi:hypothetical protein
MASNLGIGGFLARIVFAMALVLGTYNPTEFSYISWAFSEGHEFGPVTALVGIALLIAWIVFARATFLSIGWLGIVLGAALFSCIVWLFVDLGWLSLDSPTAITWIALLMLAMILAVGLSWSHIRRRLTGQVDVDDVED